MRHPLAASIAATVIWAALAPQSSAQDAEGIGEQIGRQIDRGLERLGSELEETWTDIRRSIDKLSVQGRVYGRLRWDKEIDVDRLDIDVRGKDVVILTGTVADEAARRKAVQLARDTVGVREVVDQLVVAPAAVERTTPTTNE
jgi:hypothetical protein